MREATVDAQMESHPLRRDLEEHLELNEKLARRIPRDERKGERLAHRDLNRVGKRLDVLSDKCVMIF
ncbi:MAG: hypothetical protein Ct9H90mP14_2910 [Methanobacteriota archaeon]|nr:MAG: hypothetical protein Ct9H90mP14_2910 [Euryarchaeota archaeon]